MTKAGLANSAQVLVAKRLPVLPCLRGGRAFALVTFGFGREPPDADPMCRILGAWLTAVAEVPPMPSGVPEQSLPSRSGRGLAP